MGSILSYSVTVSMWPTPQGGSASPVVRFRFPSGVPITFIRATATNGFSGTVDSTGVTFTGGSIFNVFYGPRTATFVIAVIPNAAGLLTSDGGKVVVDPDNLIAESNETNNTAQTITASVRRALFDYDGDGRTDHSVFRPLNGTWYLETSTARYEGVHFGGDGDKLVAGGL